MTTGSPARRQRMGRSARPSTLIAWPILSSESLITGHTPGQGQNINAASVHKRFADRVVT